MKMLRTFRECATNTHETDHETHRKMSTFTHKTPNEHTFCGCIRICGHDKYAPTAADGLPIMFERIANNTIFKNKTHLFAKQKGGF